MYDAISFGMLDLKPYCPSTSAIHAHTCVCVSYYK